MLVDAFLYFDEKELVELRIKYLNDLVDHFPCDIRQTEITPAEMIGKPFMVDSHQVENRCMIVVQVNRVFDRPEAVLVGLAIDQAASDACSNQQGTKGVMPGASSGAPGIRWSAAEFRTDGNERIVEQASLLEVIE